MYNFFFTDEIYNVDKERAIRIINRINNKIDALNENKKLNENEKKELFECRALLVKILKYQFKL
jgi:hypothetical protein